METLSNWLEMFGPDCIWWSNKGFDSWAGAPVMYCLSDNELASAYRWVNEKHLPIAALIGFHPSNEESILWKRKKSPWTLKNNSTYVFS